MVWHTTEQPGVWHDELGSIERVFYGMSKAFATLGKEHGSVYCYCRIRCGVGLQQIITTSLRDAWKQLRSEYPALGIVVQEGRKAYRAPTLETVEQWTKDTFWVEAAANVGDIIPTLHMRSLPCLIYVPQASTIIFHSSHWRIDALGMCMVLNRFFDIVAEQQSVTFPPVDWSHEPSRLPVSLEDAAGSISLEQSTDSMQVLAQTIRRRNFETAYPSAGLPCKGDTKTRPKTHRRYGVRFTTDSTTQFLAACRREHISVTAAAHAACAEAVFSQSRHDQYSTIVSVNLRDSLRAPSGTAQHACATYVSGITHTTQRADDFRKRSAKLTRAYRGGDWEMPAYLAALRMVVKVHMDALAEINSAAVPREPATNITVSSLGLVEKYLKKSHGEDAVTVEDFQLGSAIMTRQPTLYIWTFEGRLTLSLDFNEAYYDLKAIAALLTTMLECLTRELDISIEVEQD